VTRDPSGYGGGVNLYGFAGDNPVNEMDPSGLDPQDGSADGDDPTTYLGNALNNLTADDWLNIARHDDVVQAMEALGNGVSYIPLPDNPVADVRAAEAIGDGLEATAKAIQAAGYSRDSTVAIIQAEKGGVKHYLVGSSTGRFSTKQMALIKSKGLTPIIGNRVSDEHAEELIVRLGQANGYKFGGGTLAASRRVCLDCQIRVVHRYGLRSVTAFSGRFSRNRMGVLRSAADELGR
jgi:hypothetical protein